LPFSFSCSAHTYVIAKKHSIMNSGIIRVLQGDITRMEVDAIVNAANTSLLGGGGVDGAIHRAAGPQLLAECQDIRNRQGGCKVGEAVITGAGKLPARYVIHTVGPVWNGVNPQTDTLLANAYRNSLQLAAKHSVRTIAFPNISTGIYRFPKDLAAKIAVATVQSFLEEDSSVAEVIFVCFDSENFGLYTALLDD
jgi:O-acetyl-ADP-ribose deacetylase